MGSIKRGHVERVGGIPIRRAASQIGGPSLKNTHKFNPLTFYGINSAF